MFQELCSTDEFPHLPLTTDMEKFLWSATSFLWWKIYAVYISSGHFMLQCFRSFKSDGYQQYSLDIHRHTFKSCTDIIYSCKPILKTWSCADAGRCDDSGAVTSAADGTLCGKDFIIDHIRKGESIEEVLGHANHQVTFGIQASLPELLLVEKSNNGCTGNKMIRLLRAIGTFRGWQCWTKSKQQLDRLSERSVWTQAVQRSSQPALPRASQLTPIWSSDIAKPCPLAACFSRQGLRVQNGGCLEECKMAWATWQGIEHVLLDGHALEILRPWNMPNTSFYRCFCLLLHAD